MIHTGNVATRIKIPTKGVYYGVFLGEDTPTRKRVENNINTAGKTPAIVMWFHAFSIGFDFPYKPCGIVHNMGATPFIKLEPWSWRGKDDDSFSLHKIIRGEYDRGLKDFAWGARMWGNPLLLCFGHEMNAPFENRWYPWAGIPEDYKAAFKHVCKVFDDTEAKNVEWVYNVNEYDASLIPHYYPGDEYISWLAIDGFNFGNTQSWSQWRSFEEIFSRPYQTLSMLSPTKPIMIGETSSSEHGGNKAQWIKEATEIPKRYPSLKAFIWFDLAKETNWQIRSSEQSAEAFRQSVGEDSYFIGGQKYKGTTIHPQEVVFGLTDELGRQGDEYQIWRGNILRSLTFLKDNYGVQYDSSDISHILRILNLFQKFTGIGRENPKGGEYNFSCQKEFRNELSAWLRLNGLDEGVYVSALLTTLARPSTNEEIYRNMDARNENLRALFLSDQFMNLITRFKLKLGFAGSFMRGAFTGFSDIDLCWQGEMPRTISSEELRIPASEKGVDLFIYSKGTPVYWLTEEDINAFRTTPFYLREIYDKIIR